MKFASTRFVTNEIDKLISFYSTLTGVSAARLAPDFAELRLPGATLAFSTERAVKQFNAGAGTAATNSSAIIEFQVEDVDAVRTRLGDEADYAMMPTDQPWGNRSMLLRDPDGNLINIFAPITRDA